MARPYSIDLRERVVRAVEGGLSRRRAAGVFEVAISTVVEWVRVWRQSGSLAAKPMGGDHSTRLKGERSWLLERIAAVPDLTLEEIRAELAARGNHVGYGTVWRLFAAEGVRFKKIVHAAEQERPDVAAARAAWRENQPALDPARLVFIDETGTATNMARLRGRANRGRRVVGRGPLENDDLCRRLAPQRDHRTLRHRPCDDRRDLCRIPAAMPSADFVARRHRRHGQPAGPQERRRAPDHQSGRRRVALPAALLARPQPDRAGHRQTQSPSTQGSGALNRRPLAAHRQTA